MVDCALKVLRAAHRPGTRGAPSWERAASAPAGRAGRGDPGQCARRQRQGRRVAAARRDSSVARAGDHGWARRAHHRGLPTISGRATDRSRHLTHDLVSHVMVC